MAQFAGRGGKFGFSTRAMSWWVMKNNITNLNECCLVGRRKASQLFPEAFNVLTFVDYLAYGDNLDKGKAVSDLSREEEGDCGGLLFLERSWAADERTVPKINSQEEGRIP